MSASKVVLKEKKVRISRVWNNIQTKAYNKTTIKIPQHPILSNIETTLPLRNYTLYIFVHNLTVRTSTIVYTQQKIYFKVFNFL